MYQLQEKQLDVLLLEGTRLLSTLTQSRLPGKVDIQQFGNALREIQTTTRNQVHPSQVGMIERLMS